MDSFWVVRRRNQGGHPVFQTASRNVRCLHGNGEDSRSSISGEAASQATTLGIWNLRCLLEMKAGLAVGYRVQGKRNIWVGEIDLGSDVI